MNLRRLLLILSLWPCLAFSQTRFPAEALSKFHYLIPLTDAQVERLLDKGLHDIPLEELAAPTDSVESPAYSLRDSLAGGYYLEIWAAGNMEMRNLLTSHRLQAFRVGSQRELALVVLDSLGQEVRDADVTVEGKKMAFDSQTGTYRLTKPMKKGLLIIRWQGHSDFFDLKDLRKEKATSGFRYRTRGWRRLLYALQKPFQVQPLAARTQGYVATSQPMYRPGDTVRLKALVLKPNGKPVDRPIYLNAGQFYNDVRPLDTLQPYRPGAYAFEFVLEDSLRFQLDREVNLLLWKKKGKPYFTTSFLLSDYELKDVQASLTSDETDMYRGEPFYVTAHLTDQNNLNIPGGRVKLFLLEQGLPNKPQTNPLVFVPDTLWEKELVLDPIGATRILLPDSLLPPVDLTMILYATFLTVDGESKSENVILSFHHNPCRLKLEQQGDSLFAYTEDCPDTKEPARLLGFGHSGILLDQPVTLPARLPLRTDVGMYLLKWQGQEERLEMNSGGWTIYPPLGAVPTLPSDRQIRGSGVSWEPRRSADSLFVAVSNPLELPLRWELLREKEVMLRGHGTMLNLARPADPGSQYVLHLSYLWGGEMQENRIPLNWDPEELSLSTSLPARVFPGERVEVELALHRADGQPVPDADITAFAMTTAFPNIRLTMVPFQRVPVKDKPAKHQYEVNEVSQQTGSDTLNFPLWARRFGLDSLMAYQMLYPQDGRARFQVPSAEGETQIAMFVVSHGKIMPLSYAGIDGFPVFVNGLHHGRPYSFPVADGLHRLQIRTEKHLLKLDSVIVEQGMKTVVVVDLDRPGRNTIVEQAGNFSKDDLARIRPSVLKLAGGNVADAYFRQGNTVVPTDLRPVYSRYAPIELFGPFRHDNLSYVVPGHYSLTQPFEPGYQYTFGPGLWKMRSWEIETKELAGLLDPWSNYTFEFRKLQDSVQTEAWYLAAWRYEHMQRMLNRIHYARMRRNAATHLEILLRKAKESPLVLAASALVPQADSGQVLIFPGSVTLLMQLPAGSHDLHLWLADGRHAVVPQLVLDRAGSWQVLLDSLDWQATDPATWSRAVAAFSDPAVINPVRAFLTIWIGEENAGKLFPKLSPVSAGTVYDKESGEPLAGVTIVVRGSSVGAYTDELGRFELNVAVPSELEIRYIGYRSKLISVNPGEPLPAIFLEQEATYLDEVVVTGYSRSLQIRGVSSKKLNRVSPEADYYEPSAAALSTDMEVLMDLGSAEPQTSGRMPSSFGLPADKPGTLEEEPSLAGVPSALRTKFRDYAYWQPSLRTDAGGKATFAVTFPDDITRWQHQVLAYDFATRRGSQVLAFSRAYLPLMARLSVPRFLVEGDSTLAFGKVQNSTSDSLSIQLRFSAGTDPADPQSLRIGPAALDTLQLVAPSGTDSLAVTFRLDELASGFFDGETRRIPLYPIGDSTSTGYFWMLTGDTTVTASFASDDSVTIRLQANLLEELLTEIDFIHRYPYFCNDQTASKLKALLMEKRINSLLGKPFTREFQVNQLIRRLQKNRNEDNLWGWWEESPTLAWVSVHVIEALLDAEEAGYEVKLDKPALVITLQNYLTRPDQYQKVDLLFLLHRLGSDIRFGEFIAAQEADTTLYLADRFRLIRLRQLQSVPYSLDSLWKYQLESVQQQLYWPGSRYSLLYSDLEATLMAYRILRDAGGQTDKLERIQGWLLAQRQDYGCWVNPYASSRILETILPDLLVAGTLPEAPVVTISGGGASRRVDQYPFEARIPAREVAAITKTGALPVYGGMYQTYFERQPVASDSLFAVTTGWQDQAGKALPGTLQAGQTAKMWVEVKAGKSAEYVQIEVPVPGGCSYVETPRYRGWSGYEVHREQRRDRVVIFCERLPAGTHRFEVEVQARFPGSYTLNPARISESYFPMLFGRTGVRKVGVE